MAYDEDLGRRIRELVAEEDGLTEQTMFGGLAFLIGGNMAIGRADRAGRWFGATPEFRTSWSRRARQGCSSCAVGR